MRKEYHEHLKKYPCHTLVDEVKWIYQATMGAGHLVSDEKTSLERILKEIDVSKTYDFEIEPMNDTFVRIHFGNITQIQAQVLNRLFIYSANHFQPVVLHLEETLKCWADTKEKQAFLEAYLQEGLPQVSHSELFKRHYQPSYRVVLRSFIPYMALLTSIEAYLQEKKPLILGIDGRCGSGKSTLGQMLADLYHIPCIAMDDFFLPLEKRSQARYQEIGGNVDYERFIDEVKQPILANQPFSYRQFDCSQMAFGDSKTIDLPLFYLIEGTYCMHPQIKDLYHLKVFMDISSELQKKRIVRRNGQAMWEKFEKLWIPLEEKYITSQKLEKEADFVYKAKED